MLLHSDFNCYWLYAKLVPHHLVHSSLQRGLVGLHVIWRNGSTIVSYHHATKYLS